MGKEISVKDKISVSEKIYKDIGVFKNVVNNLNLKNNNGNMYAITVDYTLFQIHK